MIQLRTILNVADNSGARKLQCFKVLGGSRKRVATLGDIIVCSVRDAIPTSGVTATGFCFAIFAGAPAARSTWFVAITTRSCLLK